MPGHLPSQNLSRAIHVTRSRGNKVFLSTGRPEHAVSEAVKAIDFDGGIYCAGGVVVVGGRTILDLPMDADLTAHILEVVRKAEVFFTVECYKYNYSSSVSLKSQAVADRVGMSSELQRVVRTGKDAPDMKPFADYRGEPVYKVGFT